MGVSSAGWVSKSLDVKRDRKGLSGVRASMMVALGAVTRAARGVVEKCFMKTS